MLSGIQNNSVNLPKHRATGEVPGLEEICPKKSFSLLAVVMALSTPIALDVAGLVLVDSSHIDQFLRNAEVLPPESSNESESLKFYREWFTNPPTYPTLPRWLFEAGSLGDMPLVVLTSPVKERADDLPAGLSAKFDEIWVELQKEWAKISTNCTHIIAHGSGHFIQHDQPDLVIDAILQVVEEARR